MRIYTGTGDLGTTRLRGGRKVRKDHKLIRALGDLDELQAVLGMARAECGPETDLNNRLLEIERDLWQVMAVVAEAGEEEIRKEDGQSTGSSEETDADRVGKEQDSYQILQKISELETAIDEIMEGMDLTRGFLLPGESKASSYLDFARTVTRRAERQVVAANMGGSDVQKYLNRLSDFCWALARNLEPQHNKSAVESKNGDSLV